MYRNLNFVAFLTKKLFFGQTESNVTNSSFENTFSVNPFFLQARENDNFHRVNQWRKDLPRGTRLLNQLIIQKTHPNMLRKQLLARLEQVDKTISSPIYYHLYLQKLENKLADKTPWQYGYVLQEARARLREEIRANADRAVTYLHNDMSYQLAQLSGHQIPLKLFKQTLAYYKRLVPEDYYKAMKQMLDAFVTDYEKNKNVNEIYSELQNQFNGLVQAYFEPPEEEIRLAQPAFSWSHVMKGFMDLACHPQWVLLAMGVLVGQGIQLARSNQPMNGLVAFDMQEILSTLSPSLLSVAMFNWREQRKHLSSTYYVLPLTLNMLPLLQSANAESVDTFLTTFGWSNDNIGILNNVAATQDGGSIVIGSTMSASNLFLSKWTSKGDFTWSKIIESDFFSQAAVTQLLDGNYVTFASIRDSKKGYQDLSIIKWDANGNLISGQIIGTPLNDQSACMQATSDGGVIATGYMEDSDSSATFIIKLDSNLTLSWAKTLQWGSNYGQYVQQTSNNTFTLVGYGTGIGGMGGKDVIVAQFNAEGALLQTKALGTAQDDFGNYLYQSSNQNYVITGTQGGSIGSNSFIVKLDPEMNIIWSNGLSAPNDFLNVQQNSQGNYFTPGKYFNEEKGHFEPLLIQWAGENGTIINAKVLNWLPEKDSAYVFLQQMNNNSFVAIGNGNSTGVNNNLLVKFDNQGNIGSCAINQQLLLNNIASRQFQIVTINATTLIPSLTISSWADPALSANNDLTQEKLCPVPLPSHLLEEIIAIFLAVAVFCCIICIVNGNCCRATKTLHKELEKRKQRKFYIKSLPFRDIDPEKTITIPKIDYLQIKLNNVIGASDFSTVYKGSTHMHGEVAIKEIKVGSSGKDKLKRLFKREITITANLRYGENIVQIYAKSKKWDGTRYMIMEYLANGSLAEVLYSKDGKPPINLTMKQLEQIALGIAKALHYMHSIGIIHSDLKTHNILLDENFLPKLADFGLSRAYRNGQSSGPTGKGTTGYLAPELKLKGAQCTEASDVYSYGVVLNELAWVSANTEFKGEELFNMAVNQKKLPLNCLKERKQLIISCKDVNPDKRPKASEIIDILKSQGSRLFIYKSKSQGNEDKDNSRKQNQPSEPSNYNDTETTPLVNAQK